MPSQRESESEEAVKACLEASNPTCVTVKGIAAALDPTMVEVAKRARRHE
jgi:hypothetical protein